MRAGLAGLVRAELGCTGLCYSSTCSQDIVEHSIGIIHFLKMSYYTKVQFLICKLQYILTGLLAKHQLFEVYANFTVLIMQF